MNKRNMAKALKAKIDNWLNSIEDAALVSHIRRDLIVSGGALVSLLLGETPNDYDIYFKTKETTQKVAEYYAKYWNEKLKKSPRINIVNTNDLLEHSYHGRFVYPDRIQCMIGCTDKVVEELRQDVEYADFEDCIDDTTEPVDFAEPEVQLVKDETTDNSNLKYYPRYFSTNAITLSDGIQIVIRFFGSIEKIHENFDFVHCKGAYDYSTNSIHMSEETLYAIVNKELIYHGSKYPLCSIIRTRKFISRGFTINAGQYVKMALELQELNLKDLKTFKDQLVGVDSLYFDSMIKSLESRHLGDSNFKLETNYLFEIINRVFG